ncbi:MAG: NusG domain II-containing protein [Defluviitaleaceae bacterium]|nr:NusG domain II-containing protein [Defluviitaleaceae bacterium]
MAEILKRADVVLIVLLILLAISLIFIFLIVGGREGSVVAVHVDGVEVLAVDIRRNDGEIFRIKTERGHNEIMISGGRVRMVYADCPDQYCIRMGPISNIWQTITCLPNRVIVELRNGT